MAAAWRGWALRGRDARQVPGSHGSSRQPSAGEALPTAAAVPPPEEVVSLQAVLAAPCPSRGLRCLLGWVSGATRGAWTSRPSGPGHTLTRGHWRAWSRRVRPWLGDHRRGQELLSRGRSRISPDFPRACPVPSGRRSVWEAGIVHRPERSGLPCSRARREGFLRSPRRRASPREGVGTQPDFFYAEGLFPGMCIFLM